MKPVFSAVESAGDRKRFRRGFCLFLRVIYTHKTNMQPIWVPCKFVGCTSGTNLHERVSKDHQTGCHPFVFVPVLSEEYGNTFYRGYEGIRFPQFFV